FWICFQHVKKASASTPLNVNATTRPAYPPEILEMANAVSLRLSIVLSHSQGETKMSETIQAIPPTDDTSPIPDAPFSWGEKMPRGAKSVFTRIIKEGANVPLFIGQTLANALRDLGYNDTTSAVCEFV